MMKIDEQEVFIFFEETYKLQIYKYKDSNNILPHIVFSL